MDLPHGNMTATASSLLPWVFCAPCSSIFLVIPHPNCVNAHPKNGGKRHVSIEPRVVAKPVIGKNISKCAGGYTLLQMQFCQIADVDQQRRGSKSAPHSAEKEPTGILSSDKELSNLKVELQKRCNPSWNRPVHFTPVRCFRRVKVKP